MSTTFRRICTVLVLLALLAGCSRPVRAPPIDPDVARANIERLMPAGVTNRSGWAIDIHAAFEALRISPTNEHVCAVIAVTQQESTFEATPVVPNLAKIARKEIDDRATRYRIPQFVVRAALDLESPTGKTYRERLAAVRTEDALSDVFEDFIGMVPLGKTLFADFNPVRTGGAMQVSIAYAEAHAREKRYPYPVATDIRDEVFTRRGGMYFGIAHLLDYPAPYSDMLYRFADFNAGHYASRNAAFQNAVAKLSKRTLALDGDLVMHGASADTPSRTELATRALKDRLELSDAAIRDDLESGTTEAFGESRTYRRVFELADESGLRALPRAVVPQIRLQSAKITRQLTTGWFANRVNERYKQCLSRATRGPARATTVTQ